MTRFDQEQQKNEKHLDDMMHEILSIDPSGLLAMVPGSRLDTRVSRSNGDNPEEA